MRQVPHYLIIGNGRVARHFQFYFNQLGIAYSCWHRGLAMADLSYQLSQSTHVLLLISDDAIEPFIATHLQDTKAVLIHFSGSIVSHLAYGAHPLTSFHPDLYSIEQYKAIPFVLDLDAPPFEILFPDLPNTSFRLDKSLKPKYHALCVMAGNFSCLLWQKLMNTFEGELGLPASISHTYLEQQTKNIKDNYKTALTGPLARGDVKTVEKNIRALEGDVFQDVYKCVVELYKRQT